MEQIYSFWSFCYVLPADPAAKGVGAHLAMVEEHQKCHQKNTGKISMTFMLMVTINIDGEW